MTEAWVWSWQYNPSWIWLTWFNEGYHDLSGKLSLFLNENFKIQTEPANIVASQNTYALPSWTSTLNNSVPQLWKLLRVEIKYSTSQTYRYKATPYNSNDLTKSLDYYANFWPRENPIFTIDNNNIVIYPTPLANVTAWLVIQYEPTEIDLAYNAPETAILLPWKVLDCIKEYIKYKIYWQQQRSQDANNQMQIYDKRVSEAVQQLLDRYEQPIDRVTDTFTGLMY